ncbi:hypothetical protein IC229_28775 [Spirosoma sp. BT702]|uniref:Uncharacterized protein n=1 Tax=Spirosoma profusum TaxID=2771354 RepID=A0A926Y243_9BACT|nr:hypothetical protein [Spirosoma profusum]MBD2704665.1 hypothetical protein [Spirosoma profusum]
MYFHTRLEAESTISNDPKDKKAKREILFGTAQTVFGLVTGNPVDIAKGFFKSIRPFFR